MTGDMTLSEVTALSKAVSELYAEKCDIRRDDDWYVLKLQEEVGEVTQAWLKKTGRGRLKSATPETLQRNLEDEVVDVLAQLLLLADRIGIDVPTALERKWFSYLPEDHPARSMPR